MRKRLWKYLNKRSRFIGEVADSSYFYKKGEKIKTILLSNIYDGRGNYMCSHVWIHQDDYNEKIPAGAFIAFDASVTNYIKGYRGKKTFAYTPPLGIDFKMINIRNIKKLSRREYEEITKGNQYLSIQQNDYQGDDYQVKNIQATC